MQGEPLTRRSFVTTVAAAAASVAFGCTPSATQGAQLRPSSPEETAPTTKLDDDNPQDTPQSSTSGVTKAPTVRLSSGFDMPIVGLGTYSLHEAVCRDSVASALQQGMRLVDTAHIYGNEQYVGEGIRASGVPRGEVFVITKLYPNQFANAASAIDEALEKLGVEYIDMMLLHHPGTGDVAAYQAMEEAQQAGKIRSLGLSNWYIEEMDDFVPRIATPPALVQNEIHPYYQDHDVVAFMQDRGIVVQAWYPLGGRGHNAELFADEALAGIATNHGVSVAQVMLKWNLQRGIAVIPGSSNPDHIREDASLFDFVLSDADMEAISALERGEKHDWY